MLHSKIGLMRAFVHKAMEYGLDSGIVNVKHHLHEGQPDAKLLEMVQVFAEMDGSADKTNQAMMMMAEFCRECKKG